MCTGLCGDRSVSSRDACVCVLDVATRGMLGGHVDTWMGVFRVSLWCVVGRPQQRASADRLRCRTHFKTSHVYYIHTQPRAAIHKAFPAVRNIRTSVLSERERSRTTTSGSRSHAPPAHETNTVGPEPHITINQRHAFDKGPMAEMSAQLSSLFKSAACSAPSKRRARSRDIDWRHSS
jgi:hypothetical protein